MDGHQMKHPRYVLFERAWAAGAENCVPCPEDPGLHEEIAEDRMQCLRGRWPENHLRVARDVDRPRNPGPVSDVDPAHFDTILGRNPSLRLPLPLAIPS